MQTLLHMPSQSSAAQPAQPPQPAVMSSFGEALVFARAIASQPWVGSKRGERYELETLPALGRWVCLRTRIGWTDRKFNLHLCRNGFIRWGKQESFYMDPRDLSSGSLRWFHKAVTMEGAPSFVWWPLSKLVLVGPGSTLWQGGTPAERHPNASLASRTVRSSTSNTDSVAETVLVTEEGGTVSGTARTGREEPPAPNATAGPDELSDLSPSSGSSAATSDGMELLDGRLVTRGTFIREMLQRDYDPARDGWANASTDARLAKVLPPPPPQRRHGPASGQGETAVTATDAAAGTSEGAQNEDAQSSREAGGFSEHAKVREAAPHT